MTTYYYWGGATGANDGTSEADAWTGITTAVAGITTGDTLYLKTPIDGSRDDFGDILVDINLPGSYDEWTVIEGYKDTPGDGVDYPFMMARCGIRLQSGRRLMLKYIDADNTSTTRALFQGPASLVYRCKCVVDHPSSTAIIGIDGTCVVECYVEADSSNGGPALNANRGVVINNYIVQNASSGEGIRLATAFRAGFAFGNTIVCTDPSSTGHGIIIEDDNMGNSSAAIMNTIYNFGDGIAFEDGSDPLVNAIFLTYGNLIYNCGTGINNLQGVWTSNSGIACIDDAFGNITSSNYTNINTTHATPVTKQLTASPFVDTTDYQINDATGGGAIIKGLLGIPDNKGITLDEADRISFPTHGAIFPNPNLVFETSDEGFLSLGTGDVGDTVTVSGRSFQKVDDDPIVWRRV